MQDREIQINWRDGTNSKFVFASTAHAEGFMAALKAIGDHRGEFDEWIGRSRVSGCEFVGSPPVTTFTVHDSGVVAAEQRRRQSRMASATRAL